MRVGANVLFARVVWFPKRSVGMNDSFCVQIKCTAANTLQLQRKFVATGQHDYLMSRSGVIMQRGGNRVIAATIKTVIAIGCLGR